MVCYKMPNLKVIEVEYAVFELGIERLKIHSLSAIFILNAKNHSVKQRTTLQASLASCSFFFTLAALIAENSARARDFLRGCPAAGAARLTAGLRPLVSNPSLLVPP